MNGCGCRPELRAFPPASPARFSCRFYCSFFDANTAQKAAHRGRFLAIVTVHRAAADCCTLRVFLEMAVECLMAGRPVPLNPTCLTQAVLKIGVIHSGGDPR